MQASDHHVLARLRDEAQALADDTTGMKATAGARKVNMAGENSLHDNFVAPRYFIAATR
jgi:hypothetical protein